MIGSCCLVALISPPTTSAMRIEMIRKYKIREPVFITVELLLILFLSTQVGVGNIFSLYITNGNIPFSENVIGRSNI